MSSELNENTLKPEVSSHPENEKGVEGGSTEVNGTGVVKTSADGFATQEVERSAGETMLSDGVATTVSSTIVSSCVESKRCDEGQPCDGGSTTSQDVLLSTVQSTTGGASSPEISSGHLSSDACSSGISPVILSPTASTSGVSTGQVSIPVQKPSCTSSLGNSSSELQPSNIPSGFLSDVPAPSVELPSMHHAACPLPPSGASPADLITNIEQVQFAASPALAQTSAPCPSLSTDASVPVETRLSSVETRTPVVVRQSSVEVLPSKHSATDVRSTSEGSSSAAVTSQPQG